MPQFSIRSVINDSYKNSTQINKWFEAFRNTKSNSEWCVVLGAILFNIVDAAGLCDWSLVVLGVLQQSLQWPTFKVQTVRWPHNSLRDCFEPVTFRRNADWSRSPRTMDEKWQIQFPPTEMQEAASSTSNYTLHGRVFCEDLYFPKYFGFAINNTLSWYNHINDICNPPPPEMTPIQTGGGDTRRTS